MICKCGNPGYASGKCRKCYDHDNHLKHKTERNAQSKRYSKTEAGRISRHKNARKPKTRYNVTKSSAKKRGISFNLGFDDYELLLRMPCYYCRGPLPQTGSGLDRVENDQGYTFINVVPCCGDCNKLKGDLLTFDETEKVIALIKDLRQGRVWDAK